MRALFWLVVQAVLRVLVLHFARTLANWLRRRSKRPQIFIVVKITRIDR